MEVVDVGIGRGLDPAACDLRIQALRTEAADMRTKAHTLVEMIGHLENAVDRTQALLRSARDLLLAWDALRPEERRERSQQLVSLIVVEKAGPGGDSNMARIHFRAVVGSQEAHRNALKDEMADNAPGAANNRLQADSGLEADVSQRCWLPGSEKIRTFRPPLSVPVFIAPTASDSPMSALSRFRYAFDPAALVPDTKPLTLPRETPRERAQRYQAMLDTGLVSNRAELARTLGCSRAWVTRVLGPH
jgi:hypothetical protein